MTHRLLAWTGATISRIADNSFVSDERFLTRYAVNTGWWEIDIHGRYSLVKIAFVPICACKNNQRIWRQKCRYLASRDITAQLWWRHNANLETTVLSDNGEMSERWLFVAKRCVEDIKKRVRNKIIHSLPWITIFGHSLSELPMTFTHDFVTRENQWQITSILNKNRYSQ